MLQQTEDYSYRKHPTLVPWPHNSMKGFLTFDASWALSSWWISMGTLLISRPCLSTVYTFSPKIDIDLLQSIPRLPHVPRSQMMDHLGFRRGNSLSNKYEWVKRAKHKLTIQLQPFCENQIKLYSCDVLWYLVLLSLSVDFKWIDYKCAIPSNLMSSSANSNQNI